MGKLSKYGEKRTKKKSFEKVEMIIRSKSAHAGMVHQIMAHRRSFLLNVPSDEITTRQSTIERKNQSNMTTAMHNGVHMWVGGIMSDIMYSPTDVLFWLHHANCDRLWSIWQENHANQNPNLTGTDAIMDPWSFNEQDTRDTTNFGYVYI